MKFFFSVFIFLFFFQNCEFSNPSYRACERADFDYLICSLAVYQPYVSCSEQASASTGTTEEKSAAKFRCDAGRLIGTYACEDIKKKKCGTK